MRAEKILVIAGMHGDEINGVKAAEMLRKRAHDFEKYGAEIEIISPANRKAFENLSRNNPEDNLNLNRCFPGKVNGSDSEKLAYDIFEKIKSCSFAIDLHSGSRGIFQYPHVRLRGMSMRKNIKQKIIQLASFSGLKYILLEKGTKGNLQYEAAKLGIPVITLEAGEGGKESKKYAKILERAVISMLKYAFGERQTAGKAGKIKFVKRVKIKANESGKLELLRRAGEEVKKGEVIATLNGREIITSIDGFILTISTKRKINKNEIVASIAYEA